MLWPCRKYRRRCDWGQGDGGAAALAAQSPPMRSDRAWPRIRSGARQVPCTPHYRPTDDKQTFDRLGADRICAPFRTRAALRAHFPSGVDQTATVAADAIARARGTTAVQPVAMPAIYKMTPAQRVQNGSIDQITIRRKRLRFSAASNNKSATARFLSHSGLRDIP